MHAFVYLSGVLEMTVVEGAGEHLLDAVLLQGLIATAAGLLDLLGSDTALVQKGGDVLKTGFILGVQFKGRSYRRSFAAVNFNPLSTRIVYVAQRSKTRILTAPSLLSLSSFRVRAQVPDVLISHAQLDGHHQHVIGGEKTAVVGLDVRYDALL